MDEEPFEESFGAIEIGWASDMAAFLSGLPDAELALLFQEAEALIRDLKTMGDDERGFLQMPQDSHEILTALVNSVVGKLGSRASQPLLVLKSKLAEEARLKRLLE